MKLACPHCGHSQYTREGVEGLDLGDFYDSTKPAFYRLQEAKMCQEDAGGSEISLYGCPVCFKTFIYF